jgi:outer membrane protein
MEKIMRKILLSLVSVVALLAAGNAVAAVDANLKIGVIDMQQILQKSNQIKTINEQLTKQFKPRQDKIIAQQKQIQDETNKINKEGSVINANDRNKLQDKIIKERADLQGVAVAFQRDVSNAQNQAMQGFMTKLTAVVNNIAKAGNYDLIMQRAGVPYVKENLDVTKPVLDELNK